jgi:hypothetical protein
MYRSLTGIPSSNETAADRSGTSSKSVQPHVPAPPAMFALVRLLARHAVAEFLAGAAPNLVTVAAA